MRLADYMLASQNRHAYGAFWPSRWVVPSKFDAEEDADRAAFAFWKKSQGIHIDSRQYVYQESVPTPESSNYVRSCPQCEERCKRCFEAGGSDSMQVECRPPRCSGKVNGVERDPIDEGDLRALDRRNAGLQKLPAQDGRQSRMRSTQGQPMRAIPVDLAAAFPGCISINTRQAAVVLGRKPQTLHKWAHNESGPIQPKRVGGRLAWALADLSKLLKRG